MDDRPSLLPERLSELPERLSAIYRPDRFRRAVGRLLAATGVLVCFSTSAAVGLLLHLNVAAARRVAERVINLALQTPLEGRIEVTDITSLGLGGATIRQASVFDPNGALVVEAKGIAARFDTRLILDSLLIGEGPVVLTIERATIEEAFVALRPNKSGVVPTLADTFLPRDKTPSAGASRPIVIDLPNIQLTRAAVVGEVGTVIDAHIRRVQASVLVRTDEMVSVDIRRAFISEHVILPGTITGLVEYQLRLDLRDDPARPRVNGVLQDPMWMRADLSGNVGRVPVTLNATMRGIDLDATLSLANAGAPQLREVFPFLPLERPLSGQLKARGPLPYLDLDGTFTVPQGQGEGTITANGSFDVLGSDALLSLELAGSEIDPRSFVAAAPDFRIGARAGMSLRIQPGGADPQLRIDVATEATTLFDQVLPAMDGTLVVHQGQLIGDFAVHEAGMLVDAGLRLADDDLHFNLIASDPSLADNPRLGGAASGAGRVRVDGILANGDHLDAKFDAFGAALNFGQGLASAQSASVRGTLRGPLSDLIIAARLDAQKAEFGSEQLDAVTVDVRGPLLEPDVVATITDDQRGNIRGSARVNVTEPAVANLRFSVERGGVVAEGQVERVSIKDGAPQATGIRIQGEGLGSVAGSLAVTKGEIYGKLDARAVDLDKLGKLAAARVPLAGLANLRIDLAPAEGGRKGEIELELEGGRVGLVEGVSARLSAKLQGSDVTAQGYVRLVDEAGLQDVVRSQASLVAQAALCDGVIAEVRLDRAEGQLEGPLVEFSTWRGLTGKAQVVADNLHLRCIEQRLPKSQLDELGGVLSLRFGLSRPTRDVYLSLNDLYGRTRGLTVTLGEVISNRIDVQLTGGFDGPTGTAQAQALLLDGLILADIDVASILDVPRILDPKTDLAALAREHPFEIDWLVPRRALDGFGSLPSPLAESIPSLNGEVRIEGSFWGTWQAPELENRVEGFQVAPKPRDALAVAALPALDVKLDTSYDPDQARMQNELDLDYQGRRVIGANLELFVKASDLTDGGDGPLPYHANLFAQAYDFPLEAIPALGDARVSGQVSGRVAATDLNRQPKLEAALRLPRIRIEDLELTARFDAKIDPPESPADPASSPADAGQNATVTLEVAHDDGSFQLVGYSGVKLQDPLGPELDLEHGGGVALSAKNFRLITLQPLFSPALSKFDGRLNGDLALEWGKLGDGWQGRIGRADLKANDVAIYVPQFGQELHGGTASLTLDDKAPAGTQEVTLREFEAQGISGKVSGAGRARFRGLKLERADLGVQIAKGEEIPVTVEGVPLGKASGSADIVVTPGASQIDVGVRVSEASIDLPASSSRDVIPLDDNPTILVLQQLAAPKEVRAADATVYALHVVLERVEVRSSMLDARLRTAPEAPIKLLLSDRLHVGGDILIDRGEITFNKRSFEIDQGLVRLRDEDSGNPYINMTAHWDGTEGNRIFVDYVGVLKPITDDKIRFRSDPPSSQAEILALLLFGESGATATGLVGTVGSTVATNFATDLMAAAFGGVLRDVAVNVGSTDEGGYLGAQVSLSDEFRIGGQVEQFGQSTQGGSTRRQSGGCADLFADLRFAKNWSLRGSTGYCDFDDPTGETEGSGEFTLGVDVLWQYRY